MNFALQLERLTIGYGGSAVVHEVTLEVPKGAAIALLGPNGAGKSTLLRAAAGLLKPMSGRVVLDGEDVTRERVNERARRGLCHIPDGRGVFPSLTVRDNLLLQSDRGRHEEALQLATDAFPALGSRLKQLAGTLSGGEQQMLALSRAYVSDPRVVLVDEVSLGLAPVIVDQLFEFLGGLLSRGTALLIVEQYVSRALGIAAEVYVLSRGRVVLRAASSEVSEADLFEIPQHRHAAGLIAMNEFLPFIVIGLTVGSVYGLAGSGLVLTYKTSGIFNFAYGSLAALAAYLFYFLREHEHLPWPVAAILTCAVAAPIGGIALEQLARVLSRASTPIQVLATVGITLVVLSVSALIFPSSDPTVEPYLPTQTVRIFGVNVGWDQIIVFCVAVGATAALYWFFRASRLGIAMRAVVDNPDLLGLTGEDPVAVRRWAWIIGTSFAAMAGVLLAPTTQLDALVLTMLVAQAFGAAAIGAFSSLPLTFVGGLLIGVLGSLSTKYTASYPALAGISASLPFVILFVVLVVTPRARLIMRAAKPVLEVHRSWEAPWRVKAAGSSAVVILLCLAPLYSGIHQVAYSQAVITTILLLSLGLLVRTSGQVSLCHVAFAAVGASTMAHLTTSGVPWLLALLISAVVAIPVACLLAIPAVRLSGVFLALATLGFGILVEQLFYPMHFMFGPTASGLPTSRPVGGIGPWHFATQNGFYFLLLLFMVLAAVTLAAIEHGRLGRLLRAMRDSPVALETHGTTLLTARVLVFGISAFFAALAGGLTASLLQFSAATEFASFTSLTLFATVVVIVVGAPWYAVIGAALTDLVPSYWGSAKAGIVLQLLFGVAAILYAFTSWHRFGIPAPIRQRIDRFGRAPSSTRRVDPAATAHIAPVPRRESKTGLELQALRVRYGGVTAVDNVSLRAPLGKITGLIGPNGAGKTTTFNACSGLVRPTRGQVVLNGRTITTLRPHRRARLGLGRTFQKVELFDSLTVEENVAMGCEAPLAGGNPFSQLRAKRRDLRFIEASCADALRLVGIEHLRTQQTGLLSTGQRRLVELARILAGPFDLLLLDEPSSGLDPQETEVFGSILTRVIAERGAGILLVEHDMKLVAQVCDHVYVLDFGAQIFEGSVEEMQRSPRVQVAYLGSGDPIPQV